MSLLGRAVLAMWWDMAPQMKAEFEHWHSHEHFPERLGVAGFRRASRWTSAAGGDGIFVMYEVASHDVLSSTAYLQHLNSPTPWSTRMMPHHQNMVRSPCRVLESRGGSAARHALTLRLSPMPDHADTLRAYLRARCEAFVKRPGIVGAHLLRHEAPPMAETTEQRIRKSADRVADWIVVLMGYDAQVLEALVHAELAASALQMAGASLGATTSASATASAGPLIGLYTLSHSATPEDIAP